MSSMKHYSPHDVLDLKYRFNTGIFGDWGAGRLSFVPADGKRSKMEL